MLNSVFYNVQQYFLQCETVFFTMLNSAFYNVKQYFLQC